LLCHSLLSHLLSSPQASLLPYTTLFRSFSIAALIACATISEVPGCALCALKTTGQPAASADAVSPPAVENASGKLLAPKTATGPSGIRRWRISTRGAG